MNEAMISMKTVLAQPWIVIVWASFVAACGGGEGPSYLVDARFDLNNPNWVAGFADYPVDQTEEFELSSDWIPIPAPLDTRYGLYLSGTNRSDDLIMFATSRVGDLEPNARYALLFTVEIASKTAAGCVGIGGAPGESVYVKAGASVVQPTRIVRNDGAGDYYRINLDVGSQSQGGSDAVVLGDIATQQTSCEDAVYTLKILENTASPFTVFTNEEGALWLLVAFDSGFEGTTSVFVTRFAVQASRIL
jgi:hypothetical protein